MNRLKILLMTTALITGSSALASAQEQHYQTGFSVQVRLGGHDGDKGGFFYARADGDGDRDNRYIDRDDRYRDRDRDDRRRWRRDHDDRRGWNYDHDDDRR